MIIDVLPTVLTIYLKRFNSFRKIDDMMEIPLFFTDDRDNNYELHSVVEHFGSKSGGHYTANIKVKEKWYTMDDSNCYEINSNQVIKHNAYVLFFIKQD